MLLGLINTNKEVLMLFTCKWRLHFIHSSFIIIFLGVAGEYKKREAFMQVPTAVCMQMEEGAEVEVGKKNNCCKKVLKWRRKNISWNHFLGYSWESRKSFGASLEALKGFILARYWALNGSFVCGMLLVTMIIRQRFEASTSRKKRFRSLSVASQSQKAFINATTFGVWRAGGKIESVKV